MTVTARVVVVETASANPDRPPLDIVRLDCDGQRHYWLTEPGRYEVGQDVPVNVAAGTITPVDGHVLYSGHTTGGQS